MSMSMLPDSGIVRVQRMLYSLWRIFRCSTMGVSQ